MVRNEAFEVREIEVEDHEIEDGVHDEVGADDGYGELFIHESLLALCYA